MMARSKIPAGALAVAFACLSLIPEPASAQTTGSIFPDRSAALSTRSISPEDQARQTMDDYAICLIKTRSVAVRRALRESTDRQVDVAISRLASDECLQTGQLRMPAALLRGALYRALYINDFATRSVPVTLPESPSTVGVDSSPLRLFGQCIVDNDMADARNSVLAVPATDREAQAMAGLTPALSGCVAPGQKIHFSRSSLQAILAEAVYRRAAASMLVKN